jgi:hypothetical protein
MTDIPRHYHAYMLRMWQTHPDDASTWHASLESPLTEERQTFADLESLFAFLQDKTSCHIDQHIGTTEGNTHETGLPPRQ